MIPERLSSQTFKHQIGPYDVTLPGPFGLDLVLDGEVVVQAKATTGYFYRGIEERFTERDFSQHISICDRIDPEAAFFGELAYCLAIEEINQVQVDREDQKIRILLCELSRISCHLKYISEVGSAVGNETITHYSGRDREAILDLLELITGSRFSHGFFRVGGLAAHVSEGFLERVLVICTTLQFRVKETNDFFTYNPSFVSRAANLAPIETSLVEQFGVTGPNARASGLKVDLRSDRPYGGFDELNIKIPVGRGQHGCVGDVHDRFLIRLHEIYESISLIRDLCGQVTNKMNPVFSSFSLSKVKQGESYVEVEGPRGVLGCYAVSTGTTGKLQVQFKSASRASLEVLEEILVGVRLEDVALVIASMQLNIAEIDR